MPVNAPTSLYATAASGHKGDSSGTATTFGQYASVYNNSIPSVFQEVELTTTSNPHLHKNVSARGVSMGVSSGWCQKKLWRREYVSLLFLCIFLIKRVVKSQYLPDISQLSHYRVRRSNAIMPHATGGRSVAAIPE